MTALDDFVAGYEGELRVAVLPIYFSLAIVVRGGADRERIPSSRRRSTRLGDRAFLREMLEALGAAADQGDALGPGGLLRLQDRLEHGARRYLELLAADLDDPPRGLDHLEACLETIREQKVDGDLVECGADRTGGVGLHARASRHAHGLKRRPSGRSATRAVAEARAAFERYSAARGARPDCGPVRQPTSWASSRSSGSLCCASAPTRRWAEALERSARTGHASAGSS